MRRTLRGHRRRLVVGALASLPALAGLATISLGWAAAERLVTTAMAVFALLLALKAGVVALTVAVRALL